MHGQGVTTPRSARTRRVAAAVVVFACGGVVGGGVIAFLAARASRGYLLASRSSFKWDEEKRLVAALEQHDLYGAVAYAACASEVEAHALDPAAVGWPMWYPVWGIFLDAKTHFPVQDNSGLKALALARLGALWERAGVQDAADKQYAAAARVIGRTAADAKGLGNEILREAEHQIHERSPDPTPGK